MNCWQMCLTGLPPVAKTAILQNVSAWRRPHHSSKTDQRGGTKEVSDACAKFSISCFRQITWPNAEESIKIFQVHFRQQFWNLSNNKLWFHYFQLNAIRSNLAFSLRHLKCRRRYSQEQREKESEKFGLLQGRVSPPDFRRLHAEVTFLIPQDMDFQFQMREKLEHAKERKPTTVPVPFKFSRSRTSWHREVKIPFLQFFVILT